MKSKMRIVLVAEDRYSPGRIMTAGGIILLIIQVLFFDLRHYLKGDIQNFYSTSTDWGISIIIYSVSVIMIILGIIAHRVAKWPEFVEELYPDGWIRPKLIYPKSGYEEVYCDIPPNLLLRIKKYKKKYSKRRKMWYIRFVYDFMYENKVYSNILYGWLKEPKDIKEFEKYVDYIKSRIKENTKGKPLKITLSMSGYDVTQWSELEYAKKIKEERDKLIGESSEDS